MSLEDGSQVFLVDGPVPDGIPVELHVRGDTQVKAIYSDGHIDADPSPHPMQPGERWFLSEGTWVHEDGGDA